MNKFLNDYLFFFFIKIAVPNFFKLNAELIMSHSCHSIVFIIRIFFRALFIIRVLFIITAYNPTIAAL